MAPQVTPLSFFKSTFCKTRLLLVAASLLLFFSIITTTSAFFTPQSNSFQPSAEKRTLFSTTYQKLKRGQLLDINATLVELQNYPLAPYLEYQLFRNQVAYQEADHNQLISFLRRHQDAAFYSRLKNDWLNQLGQQQDWETYLLVAGSQALNTPHLECYRLQAQGQLEGKSLSWLETSADFWRNNQPLAASCDPLSQSLKNLGFLNQKDYWQAALGLMRRGNTEEAWRLRQGVSEEQYQQLEQWRRGRLNPARYLEGIVNNSVKGTSDSSEFKNEVLEDILKRYVSSNPGKAQTFIQQLQDKELLSEKARYSLHEQLALRAAWRNAPETLQLFAKVPENQRSAEGKEWFARTQLRLGNWEELIDAIQQLPKATSQTNEWLYWLAHAYLTQDQSDKAKKLLEHLAKQRNYYGFLAARKLGKPPQMNARPAPLSPAPMQALSEKPGIQRAGELFMTGFIEEARREWHQALSGASSASWQQAAWLAQQWGWYDRSVNAIHNAGLHDALELRFPLAYLDQLKPLAHASGLDPALVLALIRKESLFNPTARSRVGALGLMQVMPTTGQQVSQQLQNALITESDLLKPEYNLPIGVHYLAELMQRFKNNPILAAAAYNAGPSRANSWKQRLGKQTDPHWVEQITFAETRDYVKSILAFREVYAWRLEQQHLQLASELLEAPES